MIGQTLAHYKILEKIGSGGMGDVYLAEDTKLDRKVALKVLPPDLAESEERRVRFQREAKAIAALDHPNIVQVFSVEEAEGIHFITMQLVHGKTLTELLPKNGFPLNKFFDMAIPLADAVAAAHQEGITHRDLKPDNMMVGEDGRIKVLDFGLAKPTSGFAGGDAESALPTLAKTAQGVIVGTVNYMSPEQAQGKTVDARSDIFSLGVVCYEMLTGRRPFRGENPAEILSSVIKDTPDSVSDLNPAIPRDLAKLIKRCLAKDPIRRLQSAVDLRNELEETKQELDSGEAVLTAAPSPTTAVPWTRLLSLAGAAVGIAMIAWITGNFRTGAEGPPVVPRLMNPVQITSAVGLEDYPTWSADGQAIAYSQTPDGDLYGGNWDIWVKQIASGTPINRTVDFEGADRVPSWSPDGGQIAFWSAREGGGYFVMSSLGGAPRRVTTSAARQPSPPQWSPDGTELACVVKNVDSPVFLEITNLDTLESRRVELPGSTGQRFDISWSPNGRFLAYIDANSLNFDITQLWVTRLEDGVAFPVTGGQTKVWSPTWSPDGTALYFISNRGGGMDLWQQPLQNDGEPKGEPRAVTGGLVLRRIVMSPDGQKVAYSQGRLVANLWRVPILKDRRATWADAEQLTFDEAHIENVDVSPDGQRLLFDSDRGGNYDLWIKPFGGEMQQVTTHSAGDWAGRWSPDGQAVAFYSTRTGSRDIWVQNLAGGPARQITRGDHHDWHPGWSADGRQLVFGRTPPTIDLWLANLNGGEVRQLTDGSPLRFNQADFSPDGSELVFRAISRDGERSLWHMELAASEPRLLTEGAGIGRWSPDGSKVFFVGDGPKAHNLWEISLSDGSERILTDLASRAGAINRTTLSSDGRYLYFGWQEHRGDIWVMDVVTDESE